ncbi:PIN domain-containing protein [Mycolicibacterium mageritense]|uniref:PIN like domain-containing protein n=1 Tax=Mycolicibacterium mageritense TaxID=53462 RepID=A0AAI8TZL8_MYCME|nr:PIN domain-containing protein [Mycolicibacterium mageritense]BDY31447.1 hypothetical protein hbim_05399 [Mycolicibacterium mageritense]
MKSVLPEWYEHDDTTLGEILKTGTIALDTNALLDLYRVGNQQRNEILNVLDAVRDRLFIPYQVALEYQRGRLGVVRDSGAIYDKLAAGFQLKQEQLHDIRDPQLKKEVQKLFDEVFARFKHGLDHLRDEHTLTVAAAKKRDPVRQALDGLLSTGAVGKRPSDDVLKERRAEAARRINDSVPPGFGDAKKPDASGDYLIWAELLEFAAESGRPMMFVSNDDAKGDWYRDKIAGESLGPRPELVAEMRAALPGHPYHQTNLASFLWLAKKHIGASVDSETIDSVMRIEIHPAKRPKYRKLKSISVGRDQQQDMVPLDELLNTWALIQQSKSSRSDVERRLAEVLAERLVESDDQELSDAARSAITALLKHRRNLRLREQRDDDNPADDAPDTEDADNPEPTD